MKNINYILYNSDFIKNDIYKNIKKDLKKFDNTHIIIQINKKTINKFSLNIIQLQKLGFNNFVLDINILNLNANYSIIFSKLNKYIFSLIKNLKIKIYLYNLPKCFFENNILKPELRYFYQNNLFYLKNITVNINEYNNKNTNEEKSKINIYIDKCINCRYKNNHCLGINKKYLDKYKDSELSLITTNNEIIKKYNLYQKNNIKNKLLIKKFDLILENFKKSNPIKLMRKILFVNSYPNNLEESSNQRFIYFIYNLKEKFEDNFNFFNNFFRTSQDKNNEIISLLIQLKIYLEKSHEFAISSAIMGDNKIRYTFYFTIDLLSKNQIQTLSKLLNLDIDTNQNYWGIGIDLTEDYNIINKKIYYKKKDLTKTNINNFIENIYKKNKIKIENFLNLFESNFKFKKILFDFKYKNNKLFSKKIEFSYQFDDLNKSNIFKKLNLDNFNIKDKDIYTIVFELYLEENKEEKINIYWTI